MSRDTLVHSRWPQTDRPVPSGPLDTSKTFLRGGGDVLEYTDLESSLLRLILLNKVNLDQGEAQLILSDLLPDPNRTTTILHAPRLKSDNPLLLGAVDYIRAPIGQNEPSEAHEVKKHFTNYVAPWQYATAICPSPTTTLFHTRRQPTRAHPAFQDVLKLASRDNWDGYGAQPFNPESAHYAHRFLQALPTTIPLPEVSVDPDGEVCLEWYKAPSQVFTVSFAPTGQLAYAGLFDINDTHGTEEFEDDIPTPVLDNLHRLFS